MSIREEIYNKIEKARTFKQYIDSAEITEDVINVIEKQIDEKIQSIILDRNNKRHDFEGDSNLESQIEMLQEWKEEFSK